VQGRWPSPDPIGLASVCFKDPQTQNRYAYVLNDPLDFTDPYGLCFPRLFNYEGWTRGWRGMCWAGNLPHPPCSGFWSLFAAWCGTPPPPPPRPVTLEDVKACYEAADKRAKEIAMEGTKRADAAMKQAVPSVDWAGVFATGNGIRGLVLKGTVTAKTFLQGAGIGVLAKALWFEGKAAAIGVSADMRAGWQDLPCAMMRTSSPGEPQ